MRNNLNNPHAGVRGLCRAKFAKTKTGQEEK
jgi:hypothetical protein